MQVIWACVHENFSACNLSISNHVTGWNTLSSTSMYTVRPPTIHVHVWSYYAALLVKPVINAGYLDQFYQTIHRLERSLSSLLYPIPPKIWTSHVIEEGMTNQNVEKKNREFFAFDIAYKSRTNKENNPISTALIWDEIQQYFLCYV